MEPWHLPVLCWQRRCDSYLHSDHLTRVGELLVTWPREPLEEHPTDCFKVGGDYWIWQRGIGGVQFAAERPEISAFPSEEVDQAWFEYLVTRSWLPAAYHIWGRQVLHASAVATTGSGDVVAFAGPSGAGKSTMAYGLGQRPSWNAVCDDTLAFSCAQTRVLLHPLPNEARLRPRSAAHYGRTDAAPEPIVWPSGPLRLRRVYFLSGEENLQQAVAITPLGASDTYVLLLEQAHALTLKIRQHNQRLMRDYLELTARISAFRLTYRKSFDAIDEIFDTIESHVAAGAPRDPAVQPNVVGSKGV